MGATRADGAASSNCVVLAHEPSFALGKLTVDPALRQIGRGGRSETVEPRVMQVLVALASARGAIVTRDELVERCWEGRAVGDDAINRALSRVRRIAAETAGESYVVETVPRVGYRLRTESTAPENVSAASLAICVLPFVNMSGDPEQEYFSDGISEDITTDLSKLAALSVTARNTAFTFKGQAVDIREISRRLGVSHVLEGSVRKVGSRVRISAQLIDGQSGDHVWAERYDRELDDIFAIQDEISAAIVSALRLELMPLARAAVERRGTSSAEAYDLYLTARQYWITGAHGDRRREEKVVRLCRRAVELDPGYAQAWALLALGQSNLFRAYADNRNADDGSTAAATALRLDPEIAEAHLPRAWHLLEHASLIDAQRELELALRLGPESWEVNKEAARIYCRLGRPADAIRCLEKAVSLEESDYHSWGMLAACAMTLEDRSRLIECAKAIIEIVQQLLVQDPDNGSALAFGSLGFALLGDLEQARKWSERALLLDGGNLYMRYNLAWPLLTIFGDVESAMDALEPCLRNGGSKLISLAATDANLDSLRGEPRFDDLLKAARARLGFSSKAFRR